MRYRLLPYPLLLACVFLTALNPGHGLAAEGDLEIMSYNIRTGKTKDGPDAWPVRKHRTIALLKKYSPDVIGLQEAWTDQVADLEKALPQYSTVGTGRVDGREANELSGIMYDTKRLRLLRSDTFWLSDTPETPGSMKWGNYLARVCTWAYFQDRHTGKFFYVFNTHFDHISQGSREESAKLIVERARKMLPKDPVIITGDLNAGEDNPAVTTIKAAGFRDTFRIMHPDEKNVGTVNGFKPGRGSNKIDYVFVDDAWQVKEAAIIDDKIDDRWPSDHLPVTATVRLK